MRTQEEIYRKMMARFALDAGFTPNETCDLAVRLHSVAAELEALYCTRRRIGFWRRAFRSWRRASTLTTTARCVL